MQATLSHYRILEQIGAGGMGVVYRAHDERLDRDVALKVLPAGALADESARKRFHKEALALSKLSHPNIAVVHDFDTQEGTDFLVEELIPGLSLGEMLLSGPLPEREIINLGSQLAEGLAAAHEQGIIHRDLKPSNIRVTPEARLKVLDFGLAKLMPGRDARQGVSADVTASLTETQTVSGTLPYMAPEQLLNEKLDARTDIWAAGCVLYEMATGQRPFLGSGPTLTDAILHQSPSPPSKLNRRVNPGLEAIVLKCLEKNPALRYASARDIAVDLHRLGTGTVTKALAAHRRARALKIGAIVALSLIVAGAALLYWSPRRKAAVSAGPKVIAVLYFKNLSGDASLDWLNGGLTEMLITNLGQLEGLEVLSPERISAIRKRLKYKADQELTAETAPEVAREAGADAFVTGSVMRLGPTGLRADVRLLDSATGKILFSDKVESPDMNGIFAMVDAMTARLAERSLPRSQLPAKVPAIEEVASSNLEAYRYYQAADDHFHRMQLDEAISECEAAVRLDPQFALAYLRLFEAYRTKGNAEKALASLRVAERLQSRLPQIQQLALAAWKARFAYDLQGVIQAREALLRKAPRDSYNRYYLASTLQLIGQPVRAVTVLREGLVLDLKDIFLWNQLAYLEALTGHETAALEACDRLQVLTGPKETGPWSTRGDVLYFFGHSDEAAAAYKRAAEVVPESPHSWSYMLAVIDSDRGQLALAENELQSYRQQASGYRKIDAAVFDAQVHQSQGDPEGALPVYQNVISDLLRGGQTVMAESSLRVFATVSFAVGKEETALRFARQLNSHGKELLVVSSLQAALGNEAAAEETLRQYSARNPEPTGLGVERERAVNALRVALARHDPDAASSALQRLPTQLETSPEDGRMEILVRGRARLLSRDYGGAEADFRASINDQRFIGNYRSVRSRAPLIEHLCHFYLGQIHEATGKREDAIREYRSFLSHYTTSHSRLPQIAEARAALKRLGA